MRTICIILAAGLLAASPVRAEIYKYKDSSGVTIYTDNLVEVPLDQRQGIQRIEEIKTPDTPDKTPSAAAPKEDKKAVRDGTDDKVLTDKERLTREKARLDKRYDILVRERKALKEKKKEAKTAGAVADYRREAAALNERIKAYEMARQAYVNKVKAYNESRSGV